MLDFQCRGYSRGQSKCLEHGFEIQTNCAFLFVEPIVLISTAVDRHDLTWPCTHDAAENG